MEKKQLSLPIRDEVEAKLEDKPAEGTIELEWTAKLISPNREQEQLASSTVTLPIKGEVSWVKVAELVHRSFKYTADLVSLLLTGKPVPTGRRK